MLCMLLAPERLDHLLNLLNALDVRGNNPFRAGDLQAALSFALIGSLLIMVGTPRLIFFTLGGASFGFWPGLLCSLGACLIGSLVTFQIARRVGRAWLTEPIAARRFVACLVDTRPSVITIALMRLLPASNLVISIGLALGRVGKLNFLLGSAIGYLPQGALAVFIGSGLAAEHPWASSIQTSTQIVVAIALLVLLSVWTSHTIRKHLEPGPIPVNPGKP